MSTASAAAPIDLSKEVLSVLYRLAVHNMKDYFIVTLGQLAKHFGQTREVIYEILLELQKRKRITLTQMLKTSIETWTVYLRKFDRESEFNKAIIERAQGMAPVAWRVYYTLRDIEKAQNLCYRQELTLNPEMLRGFIYMPFTMFVTYLDKLAAADHIAIEHRSSSQIVVWRKKDLGGGKRRMR